MITRETICHDCDREVTTDGRVGCELIGAKNDAGKIVPSCCALRRMWTDETAACPLGKWNGAALVPLPVVQATAGVAVQADALTTLVRSCLGGCKHHVKPWRCSAWNASNIKALVSSGLVPDGACPRFEPVA